MAWETDEIVILTVVIQDTDGLRGEKKRIANPCGGTGATGARVSRVGKRQLSTRQLVHVREDTKRATSRRSSS